MPATAVELGAELAALARYRLAGFPDVKVVTAAFEAWAPADPPFDAVVAFNALHWIDPHLRYAKPHELLRPGWRHGRGRMPVGAACGRGTLLDRCAGGLPGGGL